MCVRVINSNTIPEIYPFHIHGHYTKSVQKEPSTRVATPKGSEDVSFFHYDALRTSMGVVHGVLGEFQLGFLNATCCSPENRKRKL